MPGASPPVRTGLNGFCEWRLGWCLSIACYIIQHAEGVLGWRAVATAARMSRGMRGRWNRTRDASLRPAHPPATLPAPPGVQSYTHNYETLAGRLRMCCLYQPAMAEHPAQQKMLAMLDEAAMTRQHYWLWLLACGGTLLDGLSIFALGVALPLIIHDMALRPATVGLIGAAIVLGAVAGALLGGPAGDRFGRKRLMLTDMSIVSAGALLSAIAKQPANLFIGQILVGIGIGIDFAVAGTYTSEMMPKRTRGRMMVATIACQSVGMLIAAAITIAVLALGGGLQAWRVFLAAEGATGAVFLVLRFSLPESIRWSMSRGLNAQASRVLAYLLPQERDEVRTLGAEAGSSTHHVALVTPEKGKSGIGLLFAREYRSRTILVSFPWFLLDVATYGAGLFTPVILGAMNLSGQSSGVVASDFADAKNSGLIDVFLLMGFLAGLWAVPRFGRLRMQVGGFAGMAVGMAILLGSTELTGGPSRHVPLVFAGFILFNLLMNAGPNSTTFTLPPELFPTRMRAAAGGLAAGTAKIGATLGVFVMPLLKARGGLPPVLILMAGCSLLGLVVTALLGREIAEGYGLEDHQRPAGPTSPPGTIPTSAA
jgi:putative MFS transporter